MQSIFQWIFLIPVVGGSIYAFLSILAVLRFRKQRTSPSQRSFSQWPSVTILKPVRGLEKNQEENLRSACLQDYTEFQVVFSAQDPHDPVIPLLKEIEREFGSERVSVVVGNVQAGTNRRFG